MAKILPLLAEMPPEIKEKIASAADYDSKLSLRQVSKAFKTAVDNSDFHFYRLELCWDYEKKNIVITLSISFSQRKELKFQGSRTGLGFTVTNETEKWKKSVEPNDNSSYIDGAIAHFRKILKHRNLAKIHLKTLRLVLSDYVKDECFVKQWAQLKSQLKPDPSIKTKLSVQILELYFDDDPDSYIDVIRSVKPGILNEIYISHEDIQTSWNPYRQLFDLTEIGKTEQWKQANRFTVLKCEIGPDNMDTSHFSVFDESLLKFELNDVRELIEQFFLHPNWQQRTIRCCDYDIEIFSNYFSQLQFEQLPVNSNHLNFNKEVIIRRGKDACRVSLYERMIVVSRIC